LPPIKYSVDYLFAFFASSFNKCQLSDEHLMSRREGWKQDTPPTGPDVIKPTAVIYNKLEQGILKGGVSLYR
jgi:hypothetical protein